MRLVLLHALPLDERMWERQIGTLARFDPVALRLYGRGRTMDAWADSVLGEVEGELALVGASMGGYCALAAARRAPERVRALVLAGSRADPDSDERRAGRAATIETIRAGGAEELWQAMRPKLFPDEADPAVVERARGIALEQQPEELVAAVEAIRDRADATDVLAGLGDRALVVLGDRDPFVSPDEVPAARVEVLPGCGHLPSLERPEAFDRVVGEALDAWAR